MNVYGLICNWNCGIPGIKITNDMIRMYGLYEWSGMSLFQSFVVKSEGFFNAGLEPGASPDEINWSHYPPEV